MFNSVSKSIVEKMISRNIVNKNNEDIYLFGIQQIFTLLLNALSVLIISFFFNRLLFGLLFLLFFMPLRSFSGGLHASTTTRCYICSVVYYFIIMLVMDKIVISENLLLISVCSTIIVACFLVPVEDKNHKLDNVEYYFYRNIARIILIAEGLIFVFSFILEIKIIYQSCYMSITSVFLLIIGGLIKNEL